MRKAGTIIASLLLAGGAVVAGASPASAASAGPATDPSIQALSCTKSMGQTWGKGSCTGTGLWDVTVWCSWGANATSSRMSGTGTVYVYCPWGNAQGVTINKYS